MAGTPIQLPVRGVSDALPHIQQPGDLAQEIDRVGAAPTLVAVREVSPNVAERRRSEQRVDHGVG